MVNLYPALATNTTLRPHSSFNKYQYRGCFDTSSNTILSMGTITFNQTGKALLSACHAYSLKQGASYFGLKNGTICNYGSSISTLTSQLIVSDLLCYIDCGYQAQQLVSQNDNTKIKCGSSTASSIYQIQNVIIKAPFMVNAANVIAVAKAQRLTNTYVYVGCYIDAPARLMQSTISFVPAGNYGFTLCQSYASRFKAKYFGLSYGNECYWGSVISLTKFGPQQPEIDRKSVV